MNKNISRRSFSAVGAALALVAFDPVVRGWLTADDMKSGGSALALDLPHFDGVLVTDAVSLDGAADDFGHIVHRRPMAVLKPANTNDIVKLVKFARKNGIKIGPRGQAHSTQGQSQVAAGVVIDMNSLNAIYDVRPGSAHVGAGVRWIDLLTKTTAMGLAPPTLTDYIDLTVGGTLAVGGIGGQAHQHGLQVDNVLELVVVTGRGSVETCSPTHQPALFYAVLGGLGQFGVIVEAKLKLQAVPGRVRVYTATYSRLDTFLSDQLKVIADKRFDYVEGSAVPQTGGGYRYQLEAAAYFAAGHEPSDAVLTAGLAFDTGTLAKSDVSHFDFCNRLAPVVAFLKGAGLWAFPHPWLNLFLPRSRAQALIDSVLSTTTDADMGGGPILIYPVTRSALRTALPVVPSEPQFFLLSLLRSAVPPTPTQAQALVTKNRTIYETVRSANGKRYPIDSVAMNRRDWELHFGAIWPLFDGAKSYFDPDNILTPGQGIF